MMASSLRPDPSSFPPRTSYVSNQSNSLPSTPYQQPRTLSLRSRSPSPTRDTLNHSPRSTHSESRHTLPISRNPITGCKYETGLAQAKRRMPYALGGDPLEPLEPPPKRRLQPEEEKKLSRDMRELYGRLLPSAESDERRSGFVQKLSRMLNTRWPNRNIEVHVFGSSGNKLCTSESDGGWSCGSQVEDIADTHQWTSA